MAAPQAAAPPSERRRRSCRARERPAAATATEEAAASSGAAATVPAVRHDLARRRFIAGGSYVEYSMMEDGALDLEHTFTPKSQRGRGLAALVVEAAFQHAKSVGKKVVPSCTCKPAISSALRPTQDPSAIS
eukprot:SAG22_NODE_1074_length_5688_cov_92.719449_8_plen_132_part_00